MPMVDWTTAFIGLLGFTAVISAVVIFVLVQPSDLPVVKKSKPQG